MDVRVSCELDADIRTMCVHLGLLLGVGGHMQVRGWFERRCSSPAGIALAPSKPCISTEPTHFG